MYIEVNYKLDNHALVCKPPQTLRSRSRSLVRILVPVQVSQHSLLTAHIKQLSCARRLEQSSRALQSFSTPSLFLNEL